ncbi:MAG: hypothetical protein Q7T71_10070 [Herbiconiux sp.]|nr:hypothetical protein [Herbiconiux sp.]
MQSAGVCKLTIGTGGEHMGGRFLAGICVAGILTLGPVLSAAAVTPEEAEQTTRVEVVCDFESPDGGSVPLKPIAPDTGLAASVTVFVDEEFLTAMNDYFASPRVEVTYDFLPAIQAAASSLYPDATASVTPIEGGSTHLEDGIRLTGGPDGGTLRATPLVVLSVQPTPSGGVTVAYTDQVSGLFDVGQNGIHLEGFRIPIGVSEPSAAGQGTVDAEATIRCMPAGGGSAAIAGYVLAGPTAPSPTPPPAQPSADPVSSAPPTGEGSTAPGAGISASLAATGVEGGPVAWPGAVAIVIIAVGIALRNLRIRTRRLG